VQIGAFGLSAVASGCMFTLWWRLGEEGRRDVWRLYGVFTALMCIGSCAGAAAWAVSMESSVASFITSVNIREYPFPMPNPNYSYPQILLISARGYKYAAWFKFVYPLEFLILSIVKLTVLDRMKTFSAPQGDLRDKQRWAKAGRVVMVLVVAGGVVGICGNIASGVYRLQAADSMVSAANILASNNGSFFTALPLITQSQHENDLSTQIASLQEFSEMCTLLLMVAAFVVVGVTSARRVDSSLASLRAGASVKAKHLRRQIVVTAVVVFVTFLLRAVFASFNAVSATRQNLGAVCQSPCSTATSMFCPEPYNQFTHMQLVLLYTPEIQILVVLISSPLALLVALWGMTSGRTLSAMRRSTKLMESMQGSMLRGEG